MKNHSSYYPMKSIKYTQLTRHFASTLCLLCFICAPLTSSWAQDNILLIIADDYGKDSFSPYNIGDDAPYTPVLNQLAEQGVLMNNAYVNPVCTPTRAAMVTGRYGFRTDVGMAYILGQANTLSQDEVTIPEVLRSENTNYQTAAIGKWHLPSGDTEQNDDPNQQGFDTFSGTDIALGAVLDYYDWTKIVNGVESRSTNYATAEQVDDAKAWIESRGNGQPWFMWMAFNAPHTPFHKPPNELLYSEELKILPAEGEEGYDELIQNNPRPYFEAMVESMDKEIGRLMESVDLSTTTVIFIGDNGTTWEVASQPYGGEQAKATLYEGGVNVPLFVVGSRVQNGGRQVDELISAPDIFSTILDIAGVSQDPAILDEVVIDGVSFLPLVEDTADSIGNEYAYTTLFDEGLTGFVINSAQRVADRRDRRESRRSRFNLDLYDRNFDLTTRFGQAGLGLDLRTALQIVTFGQAIRNEQYKLIRLDDGTEEFYDLVADPFEKSSLFQEGGSLSPTELENYDILSATLDTLLMDQ